MAHKQSEYRRFDISSIRQDASILFVGGKRTGKSTVMREFMWAIKDRVYDGHVFSGSCDEDHPWEWYLPKDMVHYCMEEFDKSKLGDVISTQHKRKTLAKKFGVSCPSSILVFEDLEFLKPSIFNNQGTRSLIFNGRWVKMFCFVAYQYVMEVKMEMRGSFDYVVFTMDNMPAVRERIYKQFAGMYRNFDEFETAFMQLTQDYKVMVIDMRARSYDVKDCVFWYKANPRLGRFKMGNPDIWAPRATPEGQAASSRPSIVLLDDPPKKRSRKGDRRKKRSRDDEESRDRKKRRL